MNTPPQLPATESCTHLRRVRSVLVAGANLAGADFSSRNIFRTDFTDADLTGAYFTGSFHAKLSGTRFENSTMTGANFTKRLVVLAGPQ